MRSNTLFPKSDCCCLSLVVHLEMPQVDCPTLGGSNTDLPTNSTVQTSDCFNNLTLQQKKGSNEGLQTSFKAKF